MKFVCPSCGYHLLNVKSSEDENVKEPVLEPDFMALPRSVTSSVKDHQEPLVKPAEAKDAQQWRSDVTVADRVEIRRLHSEGYASARIRQMLGLNVTLNMIRSIATRKI